MKRKPALLTSWGVCALLISGSGVVVAAEVALDKSINETVQFFPKKGLFDIALETTIFKPDGKGPFPLAVINHGKKFGDTRFQARYRPLSAVRYFLQRGYAVVVPMRQGFAKSGGSYIGGGCNVESNGRSQAEDVKAVLDGVLMQSWADKTRIVVVGQSHGGWTTLAFGAQNYPGVKGLVNFAGGLRQDDCPGWQKTLTRSAADYAAQTRLPSVWFYGDNDSYFNADTFRPMYESYVSAGGNAHLVAYGKFCSDSHRLFGTRAGEAIWQPEVTRFLESVGLPYEPQAGYAAFAAAGFSPMPPATEFAALEDESRLPFVSESGRVGYKAYLTKSLPRAFAIAPNGSWGWADGGDDPLKRALDNCNKRGKSECKLYSADNLVVWKSE